MTECSYSDILKYVLLLNSNLIKLTVSNFSFFMTIHNSFVFEGSNSSVLVTTQN